MRSFLLLLIFLPAFTALSGQRFSYVHYDTKDGLAGSVVYCAAEDKDGFLWFGTETGLSRFDGTHFHNFTIADGLPDNEILKLFVDSKNRVWILPFRNSICYYWRGKLYNQDNDSILHQLSISSDINTISEDKYGNIIMAEHAAIHIISPDQKVKTISQGDACPLALPVGGGLNRDGVFTFYTNRPATADCYLYTIDGNHLSLGKNEKDLANNSINTTLLTPGVDVFRKEDTLFFSPVAGSVFSLAIPDKFIAISKIDDSLFAVNTSGGSTVYNIQTKKEIAHFLEDQTVNAIIRDSEGSLWFMCAGGGLFRVGSLAFRNLVFREKDNNLSVTSIQKINTSLYIGTAHFILWKTDASLEKISKQKLRAYKHSPGRIMAILEIDKNNLLLGTDGGLVRLTNFISSHPIEELSVKSITPGKGAFLVSSTQRVVLVRRPDLKISDTLWTGRSTCSYQQDDLFYIGTISGLYTIAPGKKQYFLGNTYPVFKSRIVDIKESPDGMLWIATCGLGVAGYKNNKLLYTLTEKDGLTSNICRNVFIAGNDIWIGTDKGLNRIHKEGGHFQVTKFGSADGLSSDIINAVYVDKNNVYVGSANGLTYFTINETAANSFCKLRITAIRTPRYTWSYDTSGLLLPHRENSIRVEFAGISYRSAGDITYRYRLKGLSDSWQTTRETFLSYPTLPSGKYELELTATNKFGIQGEPIRIVFIVEKLLWEKAWFIILVAAIMGAIVWLLVRLRFQQLHRLNEEKLNASNRIAELEQMALKAQMNPHFIFNSLNSIQKYVIEKDIKGANKFITDFSRLIRLTLDISTKQKISIDEEIKYLTAYLELEKARFGNVFNYFIQSDPAVDRLACQIPPMILQPYIENSIRHGVRYREDNEGMITVRFTEKDPYLVCIIEDNGVGRKLAGQFKSQSPIEYQSRGMALTARRMEMMNKTQVMSTLIAVEDIETIHHQPAGTRVTIHFPLHQLTTLNA